MLILAFVLLIAAGLCFLLAYLIGTRGHLHLLAGYNPRRVVDPAGLGKSASRTLLAIGTATVVLLLGLVALPRASTAIAITYVLFVVGCAVYLTQSGNRYAR